MQTVNTLWRVAGRRGFLLGGIAAALCIHAGCGKPITYERLPVGAGEGDAAPTLDAGDDTPAGPDGSDSGGAAGLGGLNGSGGAGTAGATGTGGRGPGTGGSPGTDGGGPGTGGSPGTGGATPGTGGATGTGGAGVGGRTGTDGGIGTGGGTGTGGGPGDVAQFNFETSNHGWASLGTWTGVGPTMLQRFAGQSSFGGTLVYTPVAAPGTTFELGVLFPQPLAPMAGNTVTFHVFLPASAMGFVKWIQPYVQDATPDPLRQFRGAYKDTFLIFGAWDTLSVTLPAGFASPIYKVAVQFNVQGAAPYSGAVYVDAVSW